MDILGAKAKQTLIGKELSNKSTTLTLGFNAPEKPETVIDAKITLGGEEALKAIEEL